MNDEGITKTEKVARNFISWLIYAVVFFVILGGFLWAFLYSTYFANLSFVIPIRNFYQDTYWKVGGLILGSKTYPPLGPIYTIQPQKPLKAGFNTYTLIGTFEKIDGDNALIYIKGVDQKTYIFHSEYAMLADKDLWLLLVKVANLQDLSSKTIPANVPGGPIDKSTLKTPTTLASLSAQFKEPQQNAVIGPVFSFKQLLINNNSLPIQLQTIGIRWNDKRTLSQIESDYAKGPNTPLNDTTPESFVLAIFP